MFQYTAILTKALIEQLDANYVLVYGHYKSEYREIINWVASLAVETLASGDALYHNVEHTIYVTTVGQEILRGKHYRVGGVTCEDWLHFSISLLLHDIGYVKGVCAQDKVDQNQFVTGIDQQMVTLPPGSSGASLAPYHVDRAKRFIDERFGKYKMIDAAQKWGLSGGLETEVIKRNIELTRFPIPKDIDHQETTTYPALLRAADLIGQLSDPRYLQKVNALFYEFEEIGTNELLGYRHPGDLAGAYPEFFWKMAVNYLRPSIHFLKATEEGRSILAHLYAPVFELLRPL